MVTPTGPEDLDIEVNDDNRAALAAAAEMLGKIPDADLLRGE